MLYAQLKERENRFKLALRTVIPSLLFVVTLFLLFFNSDQFLLFFILMALVSFIISYYNLYVIYNGFDKNVIDPETLVLNYRTFKELAKRALRKKSPYTLLMIRFGDLEEINAHYGREQTTLTLKKAIHTLLSQIDALGFKKVPAGSFGGGVFILSLAEVYEDVIKRIYPILKDKQTCYINEIEMEVNFALLDSKDESDCEILFVKLFDMIGQSDDKVSFEDKHDKEKLMEKRVKESIAASSLSLAYQEVQWASGERFMVEFTAKLVDKEGGLIHHSDILPLINRLGLEKQFHLLVIESVLKRLERDKYEGAFAINITAFALRHKEVMQTIFKWVKLYQIKPGQMVLLINESRYYKHIERYKEIIKSYQQMGIGIAFSGLGSVNPVLEYLKYIEVDFLKYDRSLTQHCDEPRICSFIEALNHIADARGMKKWVGMIESQAAKEKLMEMGIDLFQGRSISPIKKGDTLKDLDKF